MYVGYHLTLGGADQKGSDDAEMFSHFVNILTDGDLEVDIGTQHRNLLPYRCDRASRFYEIIFGHQALRLSFKPKQSVTMHCYIVLAEWSSGIVFTCGVMGREIESRRGIYIFMHCYICIEDTSRYVRTSFALAVYEFKAVPELK
jgi:hypothetical protein